MGKSPQNDLQSLEMLRSELKRLHDIPGYTWEKIALMDGYRGIPPGTLSSYAKDRDIKNEEHRRILRLPQIVKIELLRGRDGKYISPEPK